ncbi:MAG TPA: hypothetical protein VK453_15955 [Micromonosporaceae bacterium]|nr:hypothetical protein [Micromonosporaceae bacterium]
MTEPTERSDDELIEQTEKAPTTDAARLFDVRRVIGGLFVVYGVIVTVVGLLDSPADIEKAQGVRINLWAGLGMLALGLIFLAWQWWRPAEAPAPAADAGADPSEERDRRLAH